MIRNSDLLTSTVVICERGPDGDEPLFDNVSGVLRISGFECEGDSQVTGLADL